MAIILPPGYAQVTADWHAGSDNRAGQTVWGAALNDTVLSADVDTLSGALSAAYMDWLAGGGTYDGVTVLVGQDGPPLEFHSVFLADTSSNSNDTCPPNVQAMIDKRTGLSGRKFRGRTYMPDLAEERVDSSGTIDTTGLIALGLFADAITSALSDGPFDGQVILHNARPGPDPLPTPVATYLPSPRVATLRSRYRRQ